MVLAWFLLTRLSAASPQKRRSSRQVKRKRYTEDLEFRISEDDDSGDDSSAPKSPSSSSQLQVGPGGGRPPFPSADIAHSGGLGNKHAHTLCLQDVHEAEGPVVEKIMGVRTAKKQVRCSRSCSCLCSRSLPASVADVLEFICAALF